MDTNTRKPKLPRRTTLILVFIVWGAALLVAAGVSYFTKLNIWLCMGIVAACWVLNGVIAEIEDRRFFRVNSKVCEHDLP